MRTDEELMLAFEDNLAKWWESHTLANGGESDRSRGLVWSLDRTGGNSGMHQVRLRADTFDDVINRYLDMAQPHESSIWAYVTNLATPDDVITRFKAAGFLHTKRFEVYAHDLKLPRRNKLDQGLRIEKLDNLDRFSKTVPHPYHGPITTALRRGAMSSGSHLLEVQPFETIAYLLSVDGVPASTVTVMYTGQMAGIYDVGTLEEYRGRGLSGLLLTHALREAKRAGMQHAGLIAVAQAEPLYRRVGFCPVDGWMSFMYFSKTRMKARAEKG